MTVIMCMGLFMIVSCFRNTHLGKPYASNVVIRGCVVYATGHFLRAITYLSTSPPGSASRCLSKEFVETWRPSLGQCFYHLASPMTNCGDLLFSGHILLCLVIVCLLAQYGAGAFQISTEINTVVVSIAIAFAVAESYLILAARHHYSSDIVVAWYLTPMIYCIHRYILCPLDTLPGRTFEDDGDSSSAEFCYSESSDAA